MQRCSGSSYSRIYVTNSADLKGALFPFNSKNYLVWVFIFVPEDSRTAQTGNTWLLKIRLFVREGSVLSRCIKIINLITNLSFAERGEKNKCQWDFENIFTETEAGSVSANIGFLCEGSKWVRVTLEPRKTKTK